MTENFITFNLANKLCMVPGQNFSIEQPSNGIHRSLALHINACTRVFPNGTAMYSGCANLTDRDEKNNLQMRFNKYFEINVVYLSTAFNPLNK